LTVLSVPFLADHESKSVVAAPPIPLVADMTSGVKVACSTSHTLCSYCLLNLGWGYWHWSSVSTITTNCLLTPIRCQ